MRTTIRLAAAAMALIVTGCGPSAAGGAAPADDPTPRTAARDASTATEGASGESVAEADTLAAGSDGRALAYWRTYGPSLGFQVDIPTSLADLRDRASLIAVVTLVGAGPVHTIVGDGDDVVAYESVEVEVRHVLGGTRATKRGARLIVEQLSVDGLDAAVGSSALLILRHKHDGLDGHPSANDVDGDVWRLMSDQSVWLVDADGALIAPILSPDGTGPHGDPILTEVDGWTVRELLDALRWP